MYFSYWSLFSLRSAYGFFSFCLYIFSYGFFLFSCIFFFWVKDNLLKDNLKWWLMLYHTKWFLFGIGGFCRFAHNCSRWGMGPKNSSWNYAQCSKMHDLCSMLKDATIPIPLQIIIVYLIEFLQNTRLLGCDNIMQTQVYCFTNQPL